MGYIDMHVHSEYSHDCSTPLEELFTAAMTKGLTALNISDHCDIYRFETEDVYSAAKKGIEAVQAAREAYRGRLNIMSGIEIGDCICEPELAHRVAAIEGLDCVTGSIHNVFLDGKRYSMAWMDLSTLSDELISRLARRYFEEVREMLEQLSPDILAHPTYVARYIKNKFHRSFSFEPYREQLDDICSYVIAHGIALEVNTAQLPEARLPDEDVALLKCYYDMGGRLITVGADAHLSEKLGSCFPVVHETLRELGFTHACYFERRELHLYEL